MTPFEEILEALKRGETPSRDELFLVLDIQVQLYQDKNPELSWEEALARFSQALAQEPFLIQLSKEGAQENQTWQRAIHLWDSHLHRGEE